MKDEIKVGSKWVRNADGEIVVICYVSKLSVCYRYGDEESFELDVLNQNYFKVKYKPYIEPKSPIKVEAWIHNQYKEVRYFTKGNKLNTDHWTREPRLDYEVRE